MNCRPKRRTRNAPLGQRTQVYSAVQAQVFGAQTLRPVQRLTPERRKNAVNTFGVETYGGRTFSAMVIEQPDERGDAYTMLQDLIGDVLHLAVQHGWNSDNILRQAKANFDYENSPDYQGD